MSCFTRGGILTYRHGDVLTEASMVASGHAAVAWAAPGRVYCARCDLFATEAAFVACCPVLEHLWRASRRPATGLRNLVDEMPRPARLYSRRVREAMRAFSYPEMCDK